jgi:hypothetical protein
MGFRRLARIASVLVFASLLAWTVSAAAAERRVPAKILRIESGPDGSALVFKAQPPDFLFPPIGSDDDPATGTPGGLTIEVFTQSEGPARPTVPPGVGIPGWTAHDGAVDSFLYRGPGLAVRKIRLREGKTVDVRAADVGLDLSAPLGAVAVRVTTGTRRICAVFTADTIVKDEPGKFLARRAPGSPNVGPVCSDAFLLGELGFGCPGSGGSACGGSCPDGGVCGQQSDGTCVCGFPTDPCGGTAPVCNGECAAGEECVAIAGTPEEGVTCTCSATTPCGAVDDLSCGGDCPAGEECVTIDNGPILDDTCTCTPIGVTPCGAASNPSCDATCPAGEVCDLVDGPYEQACRCLPVDAVCGPGPGFCPFVDSECRYREVAMFWACEGEFCGGTFPTCGGACSGGRVCMPVESAGFGTCVCGTPGFSCDDPMCGEGGIECPSGEVCTISFAGPSPTCSCEAP